MALRRQTRIRFYQLTLRSLAPHLALMYLSEEYNLAPEKLDLNQGLRRDFRTSWIDFMRPKGYPSRHTIHVIFGTISLYPDC